MGNKQNKENLNQDQSNLANERRQQQNVEQKKKRKSGSCFGGNKDTNKSRNDKFYESNKKSSYFHDTRKSSIKVNNMPNAKVDDKLFADRQNKARLDIKMKRAEPYEILKDSDYFDSEMNDKNDLQRVKKVHDSCQIANYRTPQTEKLQTVQIKTYLFDRNLTKIEA